MEKFILINNKQQFLIEWYFEEILKREKEYLRKCREAFRKSPISKNRNKIVRRENVINEIEDMLRKVRNNQSKMIEIKYRINEDNMDCKTEGRENYELQKTSETQRNMGTSN